MSNTETVGVIVGVDTHKDAHAAVAVDAVGARLGTKTVPATAEGTGSYGAGLSRLLCAQGHDVLEVNRPDRQLRHRTGKSDAADAEGAARAVLSGRATALPRSGTGEVEVIRRLKAARDTALEARTQAMPALKAIVVGAPEVLREQLDSVRGKMALLRHCAALRPGPITSTTASAKAALRAIARRWLALDEEIRGHDAQLEALTAACAPELVQAHGMATGTAAEMPLLVGDDPERVRSGAAFAKLCGVCPIPASSGKTSRHRLNRGGSRRADAALYRVVATRMRGHRPTLNHVRRRTAEGKGNAEIIRCLKRFVAREIYGYRCGGRMSANASYCSP